MISYLKRNEIDTEKYDACIQNAINSRIYAFSWYLDCVADHWDVLVLNDYEAVMPLPWREKYFIKYVYLAPWIQQLGVFSIKPFDKNLTAIFLAKIPRKFKLVEQFLNTDNKIDSERRTNYILNLQNSYEDLFKNFSKGRKSDIRKAQKSNIVIKSANDVTKIIELFKVQKSTEISRIEDDYSALTKLTEVLVKKDKVRILEAYFDDKLSGGAIFLIDDKRITYLFSALSEKGRELKVMSLLIDKMIKKYANSNYIFDFEGSMLKSIASFFNSFGAEEELYYHYKRRKLF